MTFRKIRLENLAYFGGKSRIDMRQPLSYGFMYGGFCNAEFIRRPPYRRARKRDIFPQHNRSLVKITHNLIYEKNCRIMTVLFISETYSDKRLPE